MSHTERLAHTCLDIKDNSEFYSQRPHFFIDLRLPKFLLPLLVFSVSCLVWDTLPAPFQPLLGLENKLHKGLCLPALGEEGQYWVLGSLQKRDI